MGVRAVLFRALFRQLHCKCLCRGRSFYRTRAFKRRLGTWRFVNAFWISYRSIHPFHEVYLVKLCKREEYCQCNLSGLPVIHVVEVANDIKWLHPARGQDAAVRSMFVQSRHCEDYGSEYAMQYYLKVDFRCIVCVWRTSNLKMYKISYLTWIFRTVQKLVRCV